MNYEIPIEDKAKPESPVDKKEEFIANVKKAIGLQFDSDDTPEERMAKIKKGMTIYFSFINRQPEEILSDLDTCTTITSREEFVTRVFDILEPIAHAKFDHPVEYEELARKNFLEQGDFASINQLLAYNVDGDSLHLHVAPNETTSLRDMLNMLKDGLHDLAKIVRDNEDIKEIVGTSWIIASHGKLIERLGFTIEGLIDEEERIRDFGNQERRDISKAKISRGDFLSRYL